MASIYQQALGASFEKLHPQIQRRFGFGSEDGVASLGKGVMEKVWHGRFYTLPFLYVGTWRRIMFPESGSDIPFEIENYAYRDSFDRETVTWVRTFHGRRKRRFDAYMIYSGRRERIVDYLGTHQHLAVDLEMWPDEDGGLTIRSGAQRFYEGSIAFSFPMFFSGIANVREWYDEEEATFRIRVEVINPRWGRLFGYEGRFDVEWKTVAPGSLPQHLRPRREERRE